MDEERYMRHRGLLSGEAWKRLAETPVLVAGVGGLGSHVLESISRLGPLTLEIWDPGTLNAPDLNRQILYAEENLGSLKVEAARGRLGAINRELAIHTVSKLLTAESFGLESSLREQTFVLFDCLDNFAGRGEIEMIRRERGCTVFHGGVEGWYGQATTFTPEGGGYPGAFGPDFASIPPATKPILPQTVAAVASFQVGEYLHWCETAGSTPLSSAMLLYDGRSMRVDRVELS